MGQRLAGSARPTGRARIETCVGVDAVGDQSYLGQRPAYGPGED